MDMIYFLYYYNILITELAYTNNIWVFIQIEGIHVASEMCQSLIRFSHLYFTLQNKLYLKVKDWYLVKFFQDESTIDEWRIRHSIDISMRFFAFMATFPIVIVWLTIIHRCVYY